MEHLVVLYPTRRQVYIDGERFGYTNEILPLDGGDWEVSLGRPANYQPASHKIHLAGTTATQPLTVTFTPTGA